MRDIISINNATNNTINIFNINIHINTTISTINVIVCPIYQTTLGWKTYKYYYETDELSNRRPT